MDNNTEVEEYKRNAIDALESDRESRLRAIVADCQISFFEYRRLHSLAPALEEMLDNLRVQLGVETMSQTLQLTDSDHLKSQLQLALTPNNSLDNVGSQALKAYYAERLSRQLMPKVKKYYNKLSSQFKLSDSAVIGEAVFDSLLIKLAWLEVGLDAARLYNHHDMFEIDEEVIHLYFQCYDNETSRHHTVMHNRNAIQRLAQEQCSITSSKKINQIRESVSVAHIVYDFCVYHAITLLDLLVLPFDNIKQATRVNKQVFEQFDSLISQPRFDNGPLINSCNNTPDKLNMLHYVRTHYVYPEVGHDPLNNIFQQSRQIEQVLNDYNTNPGQVVDDDQQMQALRDYLKWIRQWMRHQLEDELPKLSTRLKAQVNEWGYKLMADTWQIRLGMTDEHLECRLSELVDCLGLWRDSVWTSYPALSDLADPQSALESLPDDSKAGFNSQAGVLQGEHSQCDAHQAAPQAITTDYQNETKDEAGASLIDDDSQTSETDMIAERILQSMWSSDHDSNPFDSDDSDQNSLTPG